MTQDRRTRKQQRKLAAARGTLASTARSIETWEALVVQKSEFQDILSTEEALLEAFDKLAASEPTPKT